MRILVDTHILLWALTDSPRLPVAARKMIIDATNEIYVSAASVWEISIKHSLSSEKMPISGSTLLGFIREAGYLELPVNGVHAAAVEALPHHHNDPFDRILIAQAISEPMCLLTHDKQLAKYGKMVLLV